MKSIKACIHTGKNDFIKSWEQKHEYQLFFEGGGYIYVPYILIDSIRVIDCSMNLSHHNVDPNYYGRITTE